MASTNPHNRRSNRIGCCLSYRFRSRFSPGQFDVGQFGGMVMQRLGGAFDPGAIAPPKYRPSLVTVQNVVAVPKSTIMEMGSIACKRRSRVDQTVGSDFLGVAYSRVNPKGKSEETMSGECWKKVSIMDSIVGVKGGTTLEMMVPWISLALMPDSRVRATQR